MKMDDMDPTRWLIGGEGKKKKTRKAKTGKKSGRKGRKK